MRAFEIYLQENKVISADWQRLIEKIKEHESSFSIEVEFETNNVSFRLYSHKDLSLLATKLKGFLLKPLDEDFPANQAGKLIKFKLPNKNILEVRENEELKKGRVIHGVIVHFKKIFNANIHQVKVSFRNKNGESQHSSYFSIANPLLNFEFDFKDNIKIQKKSPPLYLTIEKAAHLFTQDPHKGFLEVLGFPHFPNRVYFPLNKFEFGRHSLIVGQTGVGKSKFIELFVENLENLNSGEYTLVIIDPHASLYPELLKIKQNKINFDFIRESCNLFPPSSDPKISTELTILLFKTLLGDQFNAKTERVLKYSLYLLFLKNKMSLSNLSKFLTELEFRKEILSLDDSYEYLIHFFETEFVELQTKFYEMGIMPILVLIDELSFIPAFANNTISHNLGDALQNNFLTTFSLNRISLGEKATRLIAGLIIQQLFLIAQNKSVNKKIILIIDEISLVENESLVNILSEARKFNLSLFLSQQYLTQISPELLKGVLSNVYNYFVFKTSDEDAKILAKNIDISFSDEILIKQKEKGLSDEDLKRNLLVTLNPRECLVRAFADDKFYPCFKAKTMEVN